MSDAVPPSPVDGSDYKVDYATAGRVRELFFHARKQRQPIIERWVRSYEVLHNKMWSPNRAPWLPSPRVPEIFPIVHAIVAWECDASAVYDVAPSSDPNSDYHTMQVMQAQDLRTMLRTSWSVNNYEAEVQKFLWDKNTYGTGISKAVWDPSLANGLGDAVLRRVDPFSFYPDPTASDMGSCRYMIETSEMSDEELEERFPGALKHVQSLSDGTVDRAPTQIKDGTSALPKANPGPISPNNSISYGLPGQGRNSVKDIDSSNNLVLECWYRCDCDDADHKPAPPDAGDGEVTDDTPSDPRTRDRNGSWHWHVTVVCGDVLLLDAPATELWEHGEHPYDRLVQIETGEFWGISLVEMLSPLQRSVNRLLAAIEQNVWLAGNPVMIEPTSSGTQRTKIANRPGQRIPTSNVNNAPKWLDPPQMHPQIAMQLVTFYVGEMERISGLSAMVRGATPTGRNAQGVLDAVQEAAFVRIRLGLRNLETMLKGSGTKIASLICEFYDVPRVVAYVGPSGEQTFAALSARHFYTWDPDAADITPMRFQLQVQAGSTVPTSRQARAAEADTLFAMGAIDGEAVLQAHDFPNWPTVTARVREMQAAQGTLGQPPGARAAAGRTS